MENRVTMATVAEFRVDNSDEFPISGYAAVFNSLSQDLGGFKEKIHPKAFDRALREKHDVRALVDHDPSRIVGRTKSGTLKLDTDKHGLRVAIKPPDTSIGRDLMTSIRRGDIDQMSFAFRVTEERWQWASRDADQETDIRELLDLDLFDVSAVTYPAYEQTEIDARSRAGVLDAAIKAMVRGMEVSELTTRNL